MIVKIMEIEVNEEILGDGIPVLMLHGWGANIELLRPLAERLVPLGYKVFMLDLPGFGKTNLPPRPYTVFDYANFIIQYLDYHQLEKVNLFGHSFGGRLGLILASDYHDRINKMVLSDSAGIKSEPPLLSRIRLNIYKNIRDGLYTIGATSMADKLRAKYNQQYGSIDFQQTDGVMRQTMVQVVNQDLLDYAKRVIVPTILVWGDNDHDTPLWMGQLLETSIPDAALIVHEGAGHYAYLDYPDKTARIIDALIKSE